MQQSNTEETMDSTETQEEPMVNHHIVMVGDIMMGTTFPEEKLPPDDGEYLFRDVKGILSGADIALGNLEGPLCDTTVVLTKEMDEMKYAFRTPPSYARWLKEAGLDFLSMANNHVHDFGWEGIVATEEALKEQGIAFAGVKGRSESVVVQRKGVRYGICAFGHNYYTVQHNDSTQLLRAAMIISKLRNEADIVIVSIHGGGEGTEFQHIPEGTEMFYGEKRGFLRKFTHFCIDNGADIVFGHGPHVVRALELYKDKLIAYSLGNFCTPYGMNLKGISGHAPIITVKTDRQGRFLSGAIHSLYQWPGVGPRTDSKHGAARQIKFLSEADVPKSEATIDAKGSIRQK
jgi:poly-gamma-glutamate capsule biosynthesis protein CapA/YwtB (metallophosphatase superfamily)